MKTVMIIAGESSGDLYGSLLARALKGLWPDIKLAGIGGEKMGDAGVDIFAGISSILGITEVFSSVKKLHELLRQAKNALAELSPDVIVLIDYPDFNFRVGRAAKKLGIKVLYYVSPQVWAWRGSRVRTMGEFADKVAVILPFEEEIYRKAGIPCEFVGHPVMEEIEDYEAGCQESEVKSRDKKKTSLPTPNSGPRTPVIALLPGSRPNELKSLLPVYAELLRSYKSEFGDCRFVLPLAPNIREKDFKQHLDALKHEGVIFAGNAVNVLASSDAAVIASGTATLQAALLGIPMVVVYKVSPLTYQLAKAMVQVKNISLVNILWGNAVVSELIQRRANAGEIADELKKILCDINYRENMISSFRMIREAFSGKRPSARVAAMAGELAGWKIN